MDTLRGTFETGIPADDSQDWEEAEDHAQEQTSRELPPEAIGQDERRMQVRAYNHWASLLGDATFPSIEDLDPRNLPDFGPNSVLLDFSSGIEDPAVQFLGDKLAEECGTDGVIARLSDVPPRSLLSRITDHYMQILANQAPIGFEAEFINQRGASILYRGILLPFSSDDETIDFIYGVINWKEMADAATADELLLEIDQALEPEEAEEALDEDEPHKHHADPLTEWADSPAHEPEEEAVTPAASENADEDNVAPFEATADFDAGNDELPMPDFGQYTLDDPEVDEFGEEIVEEDDDDTSYSFASLADYIEAPTKKAVDLDADQFDPEDYRVDEAEATPAREPLLGSFEPSEPEAPSEPETFAEPETIATQPVETGEEVVAETEEKSSGEAPVETEAVAEAKPQSEPQPTVMAAPVIAPVEPEPTDAALEIDENAGLYDCLASARELAENARGAEDRSRQALYAAVGRAYDFSLVAAQETEAYQELLEDNGLSAQERAPMTPIVKLVFGVDYDKTRLTEYAAVLAHAHRLRLEPGALADFLAKADGGLKGVVNAERLLRKEESGKPVESAEDLRAALKAKLRELEAMTFEALSAEGPEFSLVMVRRDGRGGVDVIGEIGDDAKLIERAGKKLAG